MIPLWRRRQAPRRPAPGLAATAGPLQPPAAAARSPRPGPLRELLPRLRARLADPGSANLLWLASFTALGTAEVAMITAPPGRLLQLLSNLGLAGAGGLLLTSSQDLRRAGDLPTGLDAANDLAWGLQGLTALSGPSSAAAQGVSLALGVVGAGVQTATGLLRIASGLRSGDRSALTLGALDLGGGLLWLGWDLVGLQQPLYVGTYVVLMIGREAYANRSALRRKLRALPAQVEQLGGELQQVAGELYQDLARLLPRPAR